MIYDCFSFHKEFSILKIRLEEFRGLDVHHILVEADTTHSGKPKPLYFNEYKAEYRDYNIMNLTVDDMPTGNGYWDREVHQRNMIKKALKFLQPNYDDIIILGDVDEVVDATSVTLFDLNYDVPFAALLMNKYMYYLNCLEEEQSWDRCRIFRYSYLINRTPDEVRNSGYPETVEQAGWHWSSVGNVEEIQSKLDSFSHTEFNTPEFNNYERIKSKIENTESLFSEEKLKVVPIDDTFPQYVQDNQYGSLKHLIKQI